MPQNQYELIVSIDGSDDGTIDMLKGFADTLPVRAIWRPHRGRGAACNAGIRESRGGLIVLLDDDMEPWSTFLTAHLQAHTGRPRLGIMGAVPIRLDSTSPPVVRFVGSKFNRHLAALELRGETISIRDFYTGNFSIQRDVLSAVGGFDETFTLYGNEDVELAARLMEAGVRFIYNPTAAAVQYYEKDFAALARDQIAQGRTAVLCARKHPTLISRMRLGTLRKGGRPWRLLRQVLLTVSRSSESMPDHTIRLVQWLERRHVRWLAVVYRLTLDYLFWFGVQRALIEEGDRQTLSMLLEGRRQRGQSPS
jgi:glycosyltransferase involved in cell wall biosynthesis